LLVVLDYNMNEVWMLYMFPSPKIENAPMNESTVAGC